MELFEQAGLQHVMCLEHDNPSDDAPDTRS